MAHIFPFMNVENVINYIAMTAAAPMDRNVPVVDPESGLERGKLWRDKFNSEYYDNSEEGLNMCFRKQIFIAFYVAIILSILGDLLYSQVENYKLIVQFENSTFILKIYESPNTWSKTIANIANNDTVVISSKQGDWFNVKTSESIEGWFLYNNHVVWDADKDDWSDSKIIFLDVSTRSPIDINNLFFKNILLEKIESLESRLSELETKVADLEARSKMQSIRTKRTSQQPAAQVGPQPPSDDQIKQAITAFFARKVPPTWAGSLMGGKDARIQSIEIYQIGNYNNRVRYWPVRARVVGTCQANLLARYETTSFDKVGDFKIYQDDYGNWKATMDSF